MRSLPLLILFGLFVYNYCHQRIKITILYETLCPDSMRFITQQLTPAYNHLRDYMDIEFVPFGKSRYNGTQFECQHGPMECLGNKIQSCALNTILNKDLRLGFVSCYMLLDDFTAYNCSTKYGVDFDEILNCTSASDLGTRLQWVAETRTERYSPKFVPTIIFNDEFDQETQDKAYRSFFRTVCEKIQFQAPVCIGLL